MTNRDYAPLPKVKPGDKLLRVSHSRIGQPPTTTEYEVVKVGRRWGYVKDGRKFDLATGNEHVGGFSATARYMTQSMLDQQQFRASVLQRLRFFGVEWGFGLGSGRYSTETLAALVAVFENTETERPTP